MVSKVWTTLAFQPVVLIESFGEKVSPLPEVRPTFVSIRSRLSSKCIALLARVNWSAAWVYQSACFEVVHPNTAMSCLVVAPFIAAMVAPALRTPCAPVRCAIQAIAVTIGQLPVQVYRRGEDGSKEKDQDHPAYALLHDSANEWTPASTFREEITRDAMLQPHGGFAFINRVGGKPVELIRLCPYQTPVTVRYFNGEPTYEVTEDGSTRFIDRRDIIHIPSPSQSLFDLLHDAKEAIGLALVMEQYASRLFSRGARPAGILKFKNKIDPATSARMKASWQAAHGGANSGGTAIIEEGGDFQALTLNSVDSQFLEMRKFAIEEIGYCLKSVHKARPERRRFMRRYGSPRGYVAGFEGKAVSASESLKKRATGLHSREAGNRGGREHRRTPTREG